jgi:preprotein translocase subunit YajC
MFQSIAYAQDSAPQEKTMTQQLIGLAPIFVVFIIFYFLIIRPQSKRSKEEQQMRNTLQIGNKVITVGGVFGTITEIDSEKGVVSLNIAPNVNITMYKSSIASLLKEKEVKVEEKTEEKKK